MIHTRMYSPVTPSRSSEECIWISSDAGKTNKVMYIFDIIHVTTSNHPSQAHEALLMNAYDRYIPPYYIPRYLTRTNNNGT